MGVPGSRVEKYFVTLMITHSIDDRNDLSVERRPAHMIGDVETRAEMCGDVHVVNDGANTKK